MRTVAVTAALALGWSAIASGHDLRGDEPSIEDLGTDPDSQPLRITSPELVENFPLAVSPESMTQSVPSRTALATSEHCHVIMQ